MSRRGALFAFLFSSFLVAGCAGGPASQRTQQHLSLLTASDSHSRESERLGAFLVAHYAALSNDPHQALKSYEAAFKAAPDDILLAERAVFAALMAGAFEDAVRMAKAADEGGAEAALVRLTLATDAIRKGRAARAERYLTGTGFGPFNRMMAVNLRAWTALERAGPSAAREVLLQGQVHDALLDSVTLYMLGMIELAAGQQDRALEVFETVWQTGPRLALAAEAHARLLAARGRHAEALALLSDFRREVGPNPALEALRLDIEAGRPVAPHAPSLREGAALAIYAPAAALAAQSESDLPGVYFAMALALDPDLDIARTLWADALDGAGRRQAAISVLSDIDAASPFFATARGQMAWAVLREGEPERALAIARDALAQRPDRDLMVQFADLLAQTGHDGEAEAMLSRVITIDRARGYSDWRVVFARGAARERLGYWPGAESDLTEALRLSPDNPDIMNHLGFSWIDRGIRLEEGMRLISRAVDLKPNSGLILDSLGWAYFRLGDYDRAVLHLERAAELEPADPVINDHLGDAYWRTGRRLEAYYQWQRALRLGPDDQARETLETKLAIGLIDEVPALARQAEEAPLTVRP